METYNIPAMENGIDKKIQIKFEVNEKDTLFKINDKQYIITNSDIEDFFIYYSGCYDDLEVREGE